MMKQLDRKTTVIGLLATIVLFLSCGGLRLLGIGGGLVGPDGVRIPPLTSVQSRQKRELESALQEQAIKLLFFIPDGKQVRVTLGWTYTNATFGAQTLAKFQEKGMIRAYRPDGAHFIDLRQEKGKPAYVARFAIEY